MPIAFVRFGCIFPLHTSSAIALSVCDGVDVTMVGLLLNFTCLPSRVMLLLRWWISVMNAFPTLALCQIVVVFMTLRSSSASLMAVLMIAASLYLFLIMYLFIWLFLFSWKPMAALILNFMSVLVVWFV